MPTSSEVVEKLLSGGRAAYFGVSVPPSVKAQLKSLLEKLAPGKKFTPHEANELAMVFGSQIGELKRKGFVSLSESAYQELLTGFEKKAKIVLDNSLNKFKDNLYQRYSATFVENRFGQVAIGPDFDFTVDDLNKNKDQFSREFEQALKATPLSVKQLNKLKEWLGLFTFVDRSKTLLGGLTDKFASATNLEKATATRKSLADMVDQQIQMVRTTEPTQQTKELLATYNNPDAVKVVIAGGVAGMSPYTAGEREEKLKAAIAAFDKAEDAATIADVDPPFTMKDVEALWNKGKGTKNITGLLVVLESCLPSATSAQTKTKWFEEMVRAAYGEQPFAQRVDTWNRLAGEEGPTFVAYRTLILSALLPHSESQSLPESVTDFIMRHVDPEATAAEGARPFITAILSQSFNAPACHVGRRLNILNFLTQIGQNITITFPVSGQELIRLVEEAEAYAASENQPHLADPYITTVLQAFLAGNPTIQDVVDILQNGNGKLLTMLSQQGAQQQYSWVKCVRQLESVALKEALEPYQGLLRNFSLDTPEIKNLFMEEKALAYESLKRELLLPEPDQQLSVVLGVFLKRVQSLVAKADFQEVYDLALSMAATPPTSPALTRLVTAMLSNENVVNQLDAGQLLKVVQIIETVADPAGVMVATIMEQQSVENCLKIWDKMPNFSSHKKMLEITMAEVDDDEDVVPEKFDRVIRHNPDLLLKWLRSLDDGQVKLWVDTYLNTNDANAAYKIFSGLSGAKQQAVAIRMYTSGNEVRTSQFEGLSTLQDQYAVFACLPIELRKGAAKQIATARTAGKLSAEQGREIVLLVANDFPSLRAVMEKLAPKDIAPIWQELATAERRLKQDHEKAMLALAEKETAGLPHETETEAVRVLTGQLDQVNLQFSNFSKAILRELPVEQIASIWSKGVVGSNAQQIFWDAMFSNDVLPRTQQQIVRKILTLPGSADKLSIPQLVLLIKMLPQGLEDSAFEADLIPGRGMVELRVDLTKRLVDAHTVANGMNEDDLFNIAKKIDEQQTKDSTQAYANLLKLKGHQLLIKPYLAGLFLRNKRLNDLSPEQIQVLITAQDTPEVLRRMTGRIDHDFLAKKGVWMEGMSAAHLQTAITGENELARRQALISNVLMCISAEQITPDNVNAVAFLTRQYCQQKLPLADLQAVGGESRRSAIAQGMAEYLLQDQGIEQLEQPQGRDALNYVCQNIQSEALQNILLQESLEMMPVARQETLLNQLKDIRENYGIAADRELILNNAITTLQKWHRERYRSPVEENIAVAAPAIKPESNRFLQFLVWLLTPIIWFIGLFKSKQPSAPAERAPLGLATGGMLKSLSVLSKEDPQFAAAWTAVLAFTPSKVEKRPGSVSARADVAEAVELEIEHGPKQEILIAVAAKPADLQALATDARQLITWLDADVRTLQSAGKTTLALEYSELRADLKKIEKIFKTGGDVANTRETLLLFQNLAKELVSKAIVHQKFLAVGSGRESKVSVPSVPMLLAAAQDQTFGKQLQAHIDQTPTATLRDAILLQLDKRIQQLKDELNAGEVWDPEINKGKTAALGALRELVVKSPRDIVKHIEAIRAHEIHGKVIDSGLRNSTTRLLDGLIKDFSHLQSPFFPVVAEDLVSKIAQQHVKIEEKRQQKKPVAQEFVQCIAMLKAFIQGEREKIENTINTIEKQRPGWESMVSPLLGSVEVADDKRREAAANFVVQHKSEYNTIIKAYKAFGSEVESFEKSHPGDSSPDTVRAFLEMVATQCRNLQGIPDAPLTEMRGGRQEVIAASFEPGNDVARRMKVLEAYVQQVANDPGGPHHHPSAAA